MSLLFIRHGDKEYANGKNPPNKPAHDPDLLDNQKELIEKLTIDLVSKYGKPDKLIVSPFNRTRQTAKIMQSTILEKYNKFCILYYDKEVGEFLGFQKPKNKRADVSDLTAMHNKPLLGVENLQDCRERIINFYRDVEKNKNIWIITHGILISFLHTHLYEERRKFSYLDYFHINF
tara:strand:+ start:1145 stop:1672 length:528 start_codon:yes stop_codon:yes gene_type:complete